MKWAQRKRVITLLLTLALLATLGIFLAWLSRRQRNQKVSILGSPQIPAASPLASSPPLTVVPSAESSPAATPSASTASPPATPTPIVQSQLPNPSGLIIPVAGVTSGQLLDTFSAARGEGRVHDAIDIPAPQGTAVLAVAGGKILKLFQSKAGGTTVYQLSEDEKFIYYYAHLERYAEGLHEGQIVRQGETIAYVGDTGNAGAGNYHLHFSIAITSDPKRWWQGTNINPYPLLHR
jgi:peptidoglycan LD-endopeptidase LytH